MSAQNANDITVVLGISPGSPQGMTIRWRLRSDGTVAPAGHAIALPEWDLS